jgi:DNA-binding NarL/FixJ family response regulator
VGTLGKVLIIEDEPIIAEDLAYIVEQLGLCVSGVARTREEALVLAKRVPLSLILSDVRIADGGSGIRAVEEIRDEQTSRSSSSPGAHTWCLPHSGNRHSWSASRIRKRP